MVVALACTSHLEIRLPTKFKLLVSRVLSSHSQAAIILCTTIRSLGLRDDRRSDMSDAIETVKEDITNIIDMAEAIGENTKKTAKTIWESTKEETDTIKEKLKDSEKAPPKEDADTAAMESGINEEWKRRLH